MSEKKPIQTPEEKPMGKFLLHGKSAVSDAELLAILLGSGNKEESSVDLAQRMLAYHQNSLQLFSRMNIEELQRFSGIGPSKAVVIAAAIELGIRTRKNISPCKKVTSSKDAFNAISHRMSNLNHEEFWILLLNRQNRIIKEIQISKGGIAGTIVDAKLVFKSAIDHLASGVILSHNHPSGNIQPSQEDITLTRKLAQGAKSLDFEVLDHLIITDNSYYSFADEGIL
jgi:DNA repair protein RadC